MNREPLCFLKEPRMIWFLACMPLLYIVAVIWVNRRHAPESLVKYSVSEDVPTGQILKRVRLVSWNLGYAGLGWESNFVADGGKAWLPRSQTYVRANLAGIQSTLRSLEADIYLLQEVASPCLVNRQVDVLAGVKETLAGCQYVYSPDLRTRWIPPPLNINVGNALFSSIPMIGCEGRLLTSEAGYYAGVLKTHYRMLVSRFKVIGSSAQLTVVNIHLAAFDEDASTRLQQLREVITFAQHEYQQGNFVVVGGDWNLRLVDTNFPHETEERFLFWLDDFPMTWLATGWHLAADKSVPSVRTLHKKYIARDNYVGVIDGFLLSPNIEIENVNNMDVGFQYSDHQPVVLAMTLRNAAS